jgi:tetratricopeptide (TPR) repeat protein
MMDLTSIQAIRQAARAACLANNVGVDLLLTGRNSEALSQFVVTIEKLLKIVEANDDIRGLSIREEEILTATKQETNTFIFPLIKPQEQGEIVLMLAQVPSKNLADKEDMVFLFPSNMSREWICATTLIAINNAVAACEIMEQLKQAMEFIDTAWELINDQDWSWQDVLLGNALPGGQSQTIRLLLVSVIYNRGRFFLEMFNKTRLQNEQDNPRNSLLAEELNILLEEAVSSFTLVAGASNQEEGSLLILQENPAEGCRRFEEINLFLLAKAWSWLGYTFSLLGEDVCLVDHAYGVSRKNYNALCCISGDDRRPSSYCYPPTTTTLPNVLPVHAAPSA